MDLQVVAAYVFGVLLLYLAARVLLLPLRIVLRLLYSAFAGALLLVAVNFVGGYVAGVYMPVNPVTALVAGLLGIPGVVVLFVLQHLFL